MKANTEPRRGLGIIIFLVGLLMGAVLAVIGIGSIGQRIDAMAELPLSGGSIPSDVRGDLTVFARVDKSSTSMSKPAVEVKITSSQGKELKLKPYDANTSFSGRGRAGIAEFSVTIPSGGKYQLVGTTSDPKVTGWLVGEPPVSLDGLVAPVVLGGILAFLGLLFGLLTFFGAIFRKKLDAGAAGAIPPPPGA